MAFSLALGVTPELLKTKANEVQNEVDGMESDFQSLFDAIDQTRDFWIGDAGNLYRRNYTDKQKDINRVMERMQSYPTRILQMAGIYEEAEEQNEMISAVLGDKLNLI